MATYEEIELQIDDPVATITLNRPDKLNALTDRTMQELRHAMATAEASEQVVGIVLTGAGRGFCAGVDMGSLQDIEAAGTAAGMRQETELEQLDPGDQGMGADFRHGFGYLMTVRKPIIAAVNGPCAGLGFSLSMFCDMRFMSDSAMFTTSFAPRGLVAEHGMSWVLPRLIGPAKAFDLFFSSRRIEPPEALSLGLVSRVVPAEQLMDEAQGYIRELAKTSSPSSLMYMKRQVYRHLNVSLGEAFIETNELQEETVALPDFKEGIASFMERRPPNFPRITVD